MSVITKSSYIYTERKNNVYGQGDVIDFYIPPSNAILNTQDTYMVFNIKLTGSQYKACVSQRAGIYSLFRSIPITSSCKCTRVPMTGMNPACMQLLGRYFRLSATLEVRHSNMSTIASASPRLM